MEGIIDSTPAYNRRRCVQRQWTDFFNRKGKAMISATDVYRAPDSILSSLREDFDKAWLITSTTIIYNLKELLAKVVHNFGSTIVKPTESSLIVPVYRGESIEKVAREKGLKYLQTLFNTEDDAPKLIGRLEKISEKEAKAIAVWTTDQSARGDYSHSTMAIGFGHNYGRFYVDSDWFTGGRSRGVSVKFAKIVRKK